jgi:DNA-binding transcriptional ArsR family regulator
MTTHLFLVNKIKLAFHPNAFLKYLKNVKSGLKTRTKILDILERKPSAASNIAKKIGLSYSAIIHHLRLLESEGIIVRKGSRPFNWVPTGMGQKRLVD